VVAVGGCDASTHAVRTKETAIEWLANHWTVALPLLDQHFGPRRGLLQTDMEQRIARAWPLRASIEASINTCLGRRATIGDLRYLACQAAKDVNEAGERPGSTLQVDRGAKRSRNLAYAWLAENWSAVGNRVLILASIGIPNHTPAPAPVSAAHQSGLEWRDVSETETPDPPGFFESDVPE
jgi:hypothetical protein